MDYKNKYRNQKNGVEIGKRMGIYWASWSGMKKRTESMREKGRDRGRDRAGKRGDREPEKENRQR